MSVVAVVGGHGQIARILHGILTERGHTPVALVRKEEQAYALGAEGVEARLLDIEAADEGQFASALPGLRRRRLRRRWRRRRQQEPQAVSVDLGGSLKSIAGARRAGVTRFVQISAIDVDEELPGRHRRGLARLRRGQARRRQGAAGQRPGLDDHPPRPPDRRPGDGPGLARARGEPGDVTRGDVAAVVAACLDEPASIGRQWNLVGGDTPVAEAVASAGGS